MAASRVLGALAVVLTAVSACGAENHYYYYGGSGGTDSEPDDGGGVAGEGGSARDAGSAATGGESLVGNGAAVARGAGNTAGGAAPAGGSGNGASTAASGGSGPSSGTDPGPDDGGGVAGEHGSGGDAGLAATGGESPGGSGAAPAGGGGNTAGSGGTTGGGTGGTQPSACGTRNVVPACDPAVAAAGIEEGEVCAGEGEAVEPVPIDTYVMLDRSVSMEDELEGTGLRRWDVVTQAVQQFVDDPANAGYGIALGFFSANMGYEDATECNWEDYSRPVVPMGLVGSQTTFEGEEMTTGAAIVRAIETVILGGRTPTAAALTGAIDYAIRWDNQNGERKTVVMLVTDGYPTLCQPQESPGIADIACQGWDRADNSIRTFVVGIEAGFNVDQIARSGGTGQGYAVEGHDAIALFQGAMESITGSVIQCEFEIPAPPSDLEPIDLNRVQVTYKPPGGETTKEIVRVDNESMCGTEVGGWYYDNPNDPQKILVCPCTCSYLAGGQVSVKFDCQPQVLRPQ